jgi:hypothetical protein
VAEAGAGGVLADQPALEQLAHAIVARERGDQLEVERLAGDGRDLGRGGGLRGQLGRADQDRVAHGVGQRHVAVAGELQPAPPRLQRTAQPQRGRQLLDEERDPLGAVVDRGGERRGDALAERPLEQRARLLAVERPQHDLVEPAGAAQVVAQPPDPVIAREPVGAVGRDRQHRQLAERLGERRQQLERRLVGPLEVVEHEERTALGSDVRQGAPDRLAQRRAIRRRCGIPELGEQARELRA